jgi:hypothetical protein
MKALIELPHNMGTPGSIKFDMERKIVKIDDVDYKFEIGNSTSTLIVDKQGDVKGNTTHVIHVQDKITT